MKKLLFYLLFFSATVYSYADDIVRVSAIYEYVSNNSEAPEQAKEKAFEAAKQKALEDRFGLDVTKITNTLVTSRTEGQSAKSETNTFSSGETTVRGEWIETLQEEVLEMNFTNGFWIVKVRVEGRARNYAAEKADIQYTLIKDVQDLESPVTFRDGNDIFLRFSSPVAGYLCVYLVDEEQNAFCLLPYMSRQSGNQPIEANKEYIFFSPIYDKEAQEYTLNSARSSEQNILLVIFSPNEFTKAADKQGGKNLRDEQLPRGLTYEALLKWLARNQTKDPEMLVRRSIITIRR